MSADDAPLLEDDRTPARGNNAPEFTVSELARSVRRTVEDNFGYVRVRGEIGGFRGRHSSGHAYFCLKDSDATIDAVVWRGSWAKLGVKPEEGMEVIASGRMTTFPKKSNYQIVVEQLEPAGLGALMKLLEERRQKLAAEGLFDEGRKRPLPSLPAVIGVVTSPTGAVIRDILHRVSDRFPSHVVVWPVRVQGETSGAEVAAAVTGFATYAGPRPDVIIVARGGGSIEDLWGFNDEALVRAVAASPIPVISAVGHETDWTLVDHVADHRAPTPTGAAERAVPVRAECLATLGDRARRLDIALASSVERRRSALRLMARALPAAGAVLEAPRQRLDMVSDRLAGALVSSTAIARQRYTATAARLSPQTARYPVVRAGERLAGVDGRLGRAVCRAACRGAERCRPARGTACARPGRPPGARREGGSLAAPGAARPCDGKRPRRRARPLECRAEASLRRLLRRGAAARLRARAPRRRYAGAGGGGRFRRGGAGAGVRGRPRRRGGGGGAPADGTGGAQTRPPLAQGGRRPGHAPVVLPSRGGVRIGHKTGPIRPVLRHPGRHDAAGIASRDIQGTRRGSRGAGAFTNP